LRRRRLRTSRVSSPGEVPNAFACFRQRRSPLVAGRFQDRVQWSRRSTGSMASGLGLKRNADTNHSDVAW